MQGKARQPAAKTPCGLASLLESASLGLQLALK
jgi:hypothetical protein